MIVLVSASGTTIREVEDLTSFRVDVESSVDLDVALRRAGAGRTRGDHAWIGVSWLIKAAGERDEPWRENFAAMLDFADAHGWLSPEGLEIRAHANRFAG